MTKRALFFLFMLPLAATAQFSYVLDQSIPVRKNNGDELLMPWAGGLNAAQYNTMDLNGDDRDDLVLFDRIANKVITYLSQDNKYVYAQDYEIFFPAQITNWLLLRDFNCDGRKDIFTGDLFGIKIYTNITVAGGPPEWEQFFFHSESGTRSPVVLTKGYNELVNLQLQFDDLPAVSDIDGDGDLDILNVRYPGGGNIEFHKNFSKERYGTCDSLEFERVSQNYGNFMECNCGYYVFNGDDCNSGGRTKHAGGKSILSIDVNGDNDQDLLFSEASCTQLYLLENTGTPQTAAITSFAPFPLSFGVNFASFPAAFYEDVDFDGVKDLISTPNIYVNDFPASNPELRFSNWFYKNTGTNASPVFAFRQTDFLQEHMIDVGDKAVPAFADADADGDLDMFISQLASPDYTASIYLYENIGTASEPVFKLQTDNFINFSLLELYNIRLQFADVTGDGTQDMVFTATPLNTGITSLYYLSNKSSGTFDFGGQPLVPTGFTLTRQENVYLTDIDLDGIPDLLVGKANGAVQYWRNAGPKGTLSFSLEDDSFLGLGISTGRQGPRCVVGDLDSDGKDDFLFGDQTGTLKVIGNFRDASDASGAVTDIVFNEVLDGYAAHNLGGQISPTIVNIFNSTKPAIVVGNIMGGIEILRHDNGQSLPESPEVSIYPIPVERSGILNVRVDRPAMMQLYSVLGQRLSDTIVLNANVENKIQLPYISGGVYMVRVSSNNKTTVKRIVIY